MTRAQQTETTMLEGIPEHQHDEARASIHRTLTYQQAALTDALHDLVLTILRTLRLTSVR